jgi:putative hydrolases of HD superfamily
MSQPADLLEFLRLVGKLKKLKRTGWIRSGVVEPESDSDHMHRAAICAMLIPSTLHEGTLIDRDRCIRMALTHDLCESIAGDYTPHCKISKEEKHRLEREAMLEIRTMLGGSPVGQELLDLWEEYEAGTTPESRFVKDIDKFEMILQADEYEVDQGLKLDSFFDSTKDYFKTELFSTLDAALRQQRSARISHPTHPDTPSE